MLWTAAAVVDAGAVNHNGNKILLANGLSTFAIKGNPFFNNEHKSLPENPPDCSVLCNWVFDNFILAYELFQKASWSLENCVLDKYNLEGKLFSLLESPIILDNLFNKLIRFHFYCRF